MAGPEWHLAQSSVQEFALNARQVHRLGRHGVHSLIPLTGEPFGSKIPLSSWGVLGRFEKGSASLGLLLIGAGKRFTALSSLQEGFDPNTGSGFWIG